MVAFLFLASGGLKLADWAGTRGLMVKYKFPVPDLALAVAVAIELGCGLLFGLGLFVPMTAAVLIVYVVAASVMIPVRQLAEPDNRKAAVLTLIKNVAITGALLHFAARPG
jgi:putative oxidoreductase